MNHSEQLRELFPSEYLLENSNLNSHQPPSTLIYTLMCIKTINNLLSRGSITYITKELCLLKMKPPRRIGYSNQISTTNISSHMLPVTNNTQFPDTTVGPYQP